MRRGANPKVSKARAEVSSDTDKYFIKNMKFYCKGRGCRHRGPPEYKPTALCFYMKGSACSHKEIKDRIEDILSAYNGARIEDIQFVPLAVHLDTIESENRWVVTLNSIEARNSIAGTTCHIRGQKVTLRRYDDIIQLEYRKCSRSTHLMSMVNKIKKLDNGIEEVEEMLKKSSEKLVESQIIQKE